MLCIDYCDFFLKGEPMFVSASDALTEVDPCYATADWVPLASSSHFANLLLFVDLLPYPSIILFEHMWILFWCIHVVWWSCVWWHSNPEYFHISSFPNGGTTSGALQKVQRAFEDSFLRTPALLTALTFLRLSLLTSSFASSVLFTSTFTHANSAQFVGAIAVGRLKLECIILVYIGFNCIAAWTKSLFLNDKM